MAEKAERKVRDSIFTEIQDLAEDLRRLAPRPEDREPERPAADERRRTC